MAKGLSGHQISGYIARCVKSRNKWHTSRPKVAPKRGVRWEERCERSCTTRLRVRSQVDACAGDRCQSVVHRASQIPVM